MVTTVDCMHIYTTVNNSGLRKIGRIFILILRVVSPTTSIIIFPPGQKNVLPTTVLLRRPKYISALETSGTFTKSIFMTLIFTRIKYTVRYIIQLNIVAFIWKYSFELYLRRVGARLIIKLPIRTIDTMKISTNFLL